MLYLQLRIKIYVRVKAVQRKRKATDCAECKILVGVDVDLFGLAGP
jgi:hypothetical protein